MKKVILVILAGILLMASVSAVAEYKDYRLTEGDMSIDSTWGYLALDAHNTVVLSCSLKKGGWHETWYRDGKLYRGTSTYTSDILATVRDGKVYSGTSSYTSDILFTVDGYLTVEEFVAVWHAARYVW